MALWFQIAIALNLIYWSIFFFLLSRRRWTVAALMAGIFHMLFAAVVSVAPIRATLDPHYTNFGLGFIQVKGQAAAIPAALVLCWALSAAWLAVGKGKGRWMTAIAAGDTFSSSCFSSRGRLLRARSGRSGALAQEGRREGLHKRQKVRVELQMTGQRRSMV